MPRVKKVKKKVITRKKRTGILQRVEAVSFDETVPFSIGVFGKSSTGKTTFASTFPGRILFAECSGGRRKPGELRSISRENREKIDVLRITDCEQLNEMTEAVLEEDDYQTIVLDNLTSFSDLCLEQVTGKSVPAQLNWGYATQQDWGKHGALIKSFLRNIIDTEKYVVIISHERWFEPPENSEIGVSVVGPACTPTVSGWLTAALDYSVQMFTRPQTKEKTIKVAGKIKKTEVKTGKEEFCAYLPFCSERMTKFRKPKGTKIPETITDPEFTKIRDIINEGN